MSDPIDTSIAALETAFGEVEALAKAERAAHPGHMHWKDVDAAIEALRINVRAYRDSARIDRSMGNSTSAAATLSRARAVVAEARRQWTDRLAAAEAERERERRMSVPASRHEMLGQLMGAHPRSRGWEVQDAAHALKLRLEALACDLNGGDEATFNVVLDDMDAAAGAFRSSIGVAKRESRLRQSAARADAAVAARLVA